jgi:hypothetical protein
MSPKSWLPHLMHLTNGIWLDMQTGLPGSSPETLFIFEER